MLDTRSLVSALCLILVIGIVLHFVNWRIHRRSQGAKLWTLGLTAQTFGLFASLALSDTVSPHPLLIYAVNLLLSGGHVVMLYGTASFADRPFRPRIYLALVTAMLAGYSWFIFADPQPMGRMMVLGAVLVTTSALSLSRLWFVFRRDGPAGVVVLAAALSATILILCSLVLLQAVGGSRPDSVYDDSAILPAAILTLIAFETTTIFGYLLLSAGHSQAQLRRLALSDPLTGLANRRAFDRELARRIASKRQADRKVALAIFDIDRFKRINDAHGHDTGDEVLRHVAETVDAALRKGDLLARIGGEEFAVIPAPGGGTAALEELASRIRAGVEAAPAQLGATRIAVTVSVGCARAECFSARDVERLFKAADNALYAAKTGGRNRVEMAVEPAG